MPAIHTHLDLRALDAARTRLQLTWEELAAVVGADQATLWRWRNGESTPRPIYLSRLQMFGEVVDLLRQLFAGPDLAREWLRTARPDGLGGRHTPLDVMRSGRVDRVVSLLGTLARGG